MQRLAERRFSGLPRGRSITADAPPGAPSLNFRYVPDNGSQTWLGLGFRAPGERDGDEPAVELLMRVLDDGNATRLYRALSDERGLCYDVSALYEVYADVGVVEIVAECAHGSAPRVLSETLEVLRDLALHGPTPAELERAKRRLRWQMLELYDMPAELASFLGQATLSGTVATPEQRIDRLLEVTRARVRAAAERIFGGCSSLVVIGKQPQIARQKLQKLQRANLG
jgi:zinc protease